MTYPTTRRRPRQTVIGPEHTGSPGPSQSTRFFRHRSRGAILPALLAAAACGGEGAARSAGGDADHPEVRPGIEVLLSDSLHLVAGRRVGLVTNHTGVDRAGRSTIDLLYEHPDIELVALYGPEHGIRGEEQAGVAIESGVDSRTGIPVHSIYGETRKPTPEMLEGVDVLLFDIQDIGVRYYTFVWSMTLAMEAAGENGIPFVVLDRPDPIGGTAIQGTVLDPAYATFVGLYPVPMRHGLTPGELARLTVGEFGVEAELHVVPAEGWRRDMPFAETGLPWLAPSPNMPSVESALTYPGSCLFEGTLLSVGRGTPLAFQQVGAPWLDSEELARRLNGRGMDGVRFDPVTFVPESPGDGKFGGEDVHGVRWVPTSDSYDPARAALAVLVETRRMSGDRWEWRVGHFDRLAGTDAVRLGIEAGEDVAELTAGWDEALAAFAALRSPYLIYP